DPQQLLAAAADNLSGAGRERFLAEVADVAAPATTAPQASGKAERRAAAPGRVTPEMLSSAEARLARHVGPIPRLLVAQADREARDVSQLANRLASHINDPAARRSFLASMEGGEAP